MVALVAASCGTSNEGTADGPSGADARRADAGAADAGAVDAAWVVGRVDVAVLSQLYDGTPDPGATVMFMDPSGTVVQVGTTDTDGNAHADVPADSSVTVIQLSESDGLRDLALTTIRGVQPGDHLNAGRERGYGAAGGAADMMWVTYPAPPSPQVRLYGPCSQGAVALWFASECVTSTFSVLAVAEDAGGAPTAAFWQTGIDHVPDGTIDLTGPWMPLASKPFEVDNVPAGTPQLWVAWWPRNGEQLVFAMDEQLVNAPPAGTNTFSAKVPTGADYASVAMAALVYGGGVRDQIIRSITSAPDAVALDLAPGAIPQASNVVATRTGATWTASTGTADSRQVMWFATWDDTVQHHLVWSVVDRSDALPEMTLPALPAGFEQDDPAAIAPALFSELGATVGYADQDDVAGWDGARPLGAWLAEPITNRFLSGDHAVRRTMSW
jgi:hypothetical protein